jgi:hypothetical protein
MLLPLLIISAILAFTNQIYFKISISEEACLQAFVLKNDEILTKIKILNMPKKPFKTKSPLLSLLYISDNSRILSKPVEITKPDQTNLFVHSGGQESDGKQSNTLKLPFKLKLVSYLR